MHNIYIIGQKVKRMKELKVLKKWKKKQASKKQKKLMHMSFIRIILLTEAYIVYKCNVGKY